MNIQNDKKKRNYREFFENEVNTKEFQERVVLIAGKISDPDSKKAFVKHMTSDDNINLKVKVARMAESQNPIALARWFERFILDLVVKCDEDDKFSEEGLTDEFGFLI